MPTETNLLSRDASSCSRLLPDEVFAQVIEHAPLVAIDLLVEDVEQRVLLRMIPDHDVQNITGLDAINLCRL